MYDDFLFLLLVYIHTIQIKYLFFSMGDRGGSVDTLGRVCEGIPFALDKDLVGGIFLARGELASDAILPVF
jgi:hypothetical protein